MSRLPPYSTYRTDKSQIMVPQAMSRGNVLRFTPRGFNQVLNVKFPDSRLAVCGKCKKNYKTRESCRVRSGHNSAPWTTAYVCITLDDSCTDAEGNFVDKALTVRMSSWQPLSMKQDFGPKTPVCASCKKTNRTRTFCRERHKHRHLPWSTVYVILSALESTDPSTIVAAPSQMVNNESKVSSDKTTEYKTTTEASNEEDQSDTDDIYAIESSRTFLAQVSCKSNTIHWLQEMDGESILAATLESDVKALNEAIRSPSHSEMHHQMPMPPQPYYPMMSPQQQQHFYQQQQQFAAWHAQYGQHNMMMPHPMMPIASMGGHPPPHPPPPHFEGTPGKGENDERGANGNDEGDGHAPVPALDPPNQNSEENDDNVQSDFNTNSSPTTPDAQAQWHAQVMFQQQMYHQHFLAHQQYMAQHAHQQYMTQQNPPQRSDHEHDPNAVVETNVNDVGNLGIESKLDDAFQDERDEKRQRIGASPIGSNAIDPTSIDPNDIEEPNKTEGPIDQKD